MNTPQYFQMWDTAYNEIRRIAPDAKIVGPSFAYTPERKPDEWATFLTHVKDADTVPDWITNHNEGDVDDPVTVGQSLRTALTTAGIAQRPLSSNEYQPADRQSAGVTAWYLARFAQSGYANAMRGNWSCCMVPNLTGLLTQAQTGWAPTGSWWAMQSYADMTGSLLQTSGQVGSTAISAAKDDSKKQAVAILGDSNGYTGSASVTFQNVDAASYLVHSGKVHATVYRMADGVALYSKAVQYSGDLAVAADGSVTVPVDFQGQHDAFAVYLSDAQPQTLSVKAPAVLAAGSSADVPVTFTNGSTTADTQVQTSLAVVTADPADAAGVTITCTAGDGATCPAVGTVNPGASTTATFHVTIPSGAKASAYRLVGTATLVNNGTLTVQDSADVVAPCGVGSVCEAENGQLAGGTCTATNHPGYTGSGFVACFDTTATGRSVSQQFFVPKAGGYALDLRYAAGPDGPAGGRSLTVTAGGTSQQIALPMTGSWNTWGDATIDLQLAAGTSTITVVKNTGDVGWINLDHLVLTSTTPPDTTRPDVSIAAPAAGQVTRPADVGQVKVTASDDGGLARVAANLYDGSNTTLLKALGSTPADSSIGSTQWSGQWALPTDLAGGVYTIRVAAIDDAGNVGTTTRTFTVDTTRPTLAITSPEAGASLAADTPVRSL